MVPLFCLTEGSNRFSDPDFKAVNFAEAIKDRKLNGSIFKDFEVTSEISCQFECISEDRCLSYNFLPILGKSTSKCQLSDSDRFIGRENFTKEDGVLYRGIQGICEEEYPCKDNEICVADYRADTHFCKCVTGCPKNCYDYHQNGSTTDGVYWIYPDEEEPFQVLCDMTTNGGGWTVFQRRMDGSVDFYVDWESYKNGFGNLKGEFWLGNDYLHRLTTSANMLFRIDMEDYEGDRRFAKYTTFSVAGESDNYRVTIDGYRGTAGDSLLSKIKPIKNMQFTTKDRDNDVNSNANCAVNNKGGWWYNGCHNANPNGMFPGGSSGQGVTWQTFRGQEYSLKRTEIKLRPKFN
ncbi:ficolin-2-like [Stylophora pistillata]|uniref:ficolin-2-like n=1 Tax=Stylophora pistillata TaxID=50429 RepID=UPI000C04332A|nr:ficolin-2-like [Stylophora pistillata]